MADKSEIARVCFFDIESTNLVADFGTVLCASWKYHGKPKIYTRKITDYASFKKRPWDDKQLVKDICDGLSEADIWGTWYGSRFDVPFLNTRLLYHRLHPLPDKPNWDGWRVARYQLKLSSNRLKTVSEFMGLSNKTPLNGDIWVKARSGHGPSVRYVVEHCERDVEVLEQAYDRIKSVTKQHPNVTLTAPDTLDRCPVCGSERITRQGTRISLTNIYQAWKCRECGKWSRSRMANRIPPPKQRG